MEGAVCHVSLMSSPQAGPHTTLSQYLDRHRVIIINFVLVHKVLRDEDKTGEKVTRFNPILITK